jgi:sulfur carrier protein ThiS
MPWCQLKAGKEAKGETMFSSKIRALLAAAVIVAVPMATPASAAAEQRREYRLEEQDLGAALRALGQVSGEEIYFATEAVAGRRSAPLNGTYTLKEAIDLLLRGSDLVAVERNGSILIRQRLRQTSSLGDDAPRESDQILVTGTRIRGAPATSPVTAVRREDAQRAGQTDLGQIIRDLPQNFAGGQNPTIAGPGQGGTQNGTGSSALNLRGLGPDASLIRISQAIAIATPAPWQGPAMAANVTIGPAPSCCITRCIASAKGAASSGSLLKASSSTRSEPAEKTWESEDSIINA